MDDYSSIVERPLADEREDLHSALFISALGEMNDKGLFRRSCLLLSSDARIQRDGMRPAKILQNTHDKIIVEDFWNIRIVVAYGRDTREKVSNSSPPQTSLFGDRPVFPDGRAVREMNILSPLQEVDVSAFPEPREQSKFEMIMRVDQTGKNQETVEIDT